MSDRRIPLELRIANFGRHCSRRARSLLFRLCFVWFCFSLRFFCYLVVRSTCLHRRRPVLTAATRNRGTTYCLQPLSSLLLWIGSRGAVAAAAAAAAKIFAHDRPDRRASIAQLREDITTGGTPRSVNSRAYIRVRSTSIRFRIRSVCADLFLPTPQPHRNDQPSIL